jgi:DNA-directed RNA polymerase sigma subunit (sigma70/sigma32)
MISPDLQRFGAVPQAQFLAALALPTRADVVQRDFPTLYLREAAKLLFLTREEQTALGRRAQDGDGQARERVIRRRLRHVATIAREDENLSLPLLDVINEVNLGPIRAVERLHPDRGIKLPPAVLQPKSLTYSNLQ